MGIVRLEIVMGPMVMISVYEWMDWASCKYPYPQGFLGRIATQNGLSEVFAENA
jgi:hypothetical protein